MKLIYSYAKYSKFHSLVKYRQKQNILKPIILIKYFKTKVNINLMNVGIISMIS